MSDRDKLTVEDLVKKFGKPDFDEMFYVPEEVEVKKNKDDLHPLHERVGIGMMMSVMGLLMALIILGVILVLFIFVGWWLLLLIPLGILGYFAGTYMDCNGDWELYKKVVSEELSFLKRNK